MNIKVTKAIPSHIGAIMTIAAESDLSIWSRDDYLREMNRAETIFEAAETDGRCVGFIIGRLLPDAVEERWIAEIYNIGVYPSLRGRGVGSHLIQAFNAIASEKGVQEVFLEVRSGNRKAIVFYEKHGFSLYSSRSAYYSDPVEDALLMRADIHVLPETVPNKQLE